MNAVIKCRAEYDKIKDTPQDEPLVDVVLNNKNTVVYRKVSVEIYGLHRYVPRKRSWGR